MLQVKNKVYTKLCIAPLYLSLTIWQFPKYYKRELFSYKREQYIPLQKLAWSKCYDSLGNKIFKIFRPMVQPVLVTSQNWCSKWTINISMTFKVWCVASFYMKKSKNFGRSVSIRKTSVKLRKHMLMKEVISIKFWNWRVNTFKRLLLQFFPEFYEWVSHKMSSQQTSTCLKSTIETLEKGMKYVQS